MVMVFKVQGIPCFTRELCLPLGISPLQLPKAEFVPDIFSQDAVRHHCVELDHHIEDPILA